MSNPALPIHLRDLEAEWVNDLGDKRRRRFKEGDETIATAQGVMFLCPVCYERNSGPVGTHSVLIWFRDRGVPPDETPGPGRWAVSGTGLTDLTLSPSIDLSANEGGCGWHGWVENGIAR